MADKRRIFEQLTRDELIHWVEFYEIEVGDKRKKEALVDALAASDKPKLPKVLADVSRETLKAICRELEIDDSGKKKAEIVARIASSVDGQLALGKPPGGKSAGKTGASTTGTKRKIEPYEHTDKQRANNPPVGLVTTTTDKPEGKKHYRYDPHIDPALQFDPQGAEVERLMDTALAAIEAARTAEELSAAKAQLAEAKKAIEELKRRREPYLNWAGKAERTSFEIPTVSLHVHERIDPRTVIAAVKRKNGNGQQQFSLFERPEENPPLRDAIDFYKHPHNWSNRLIAGDSLLVMNSLLEKEGMAGKVQMVYIDPPYGIQYGSNFQPFFKQTDVKDRSDDDLTQEPETLRAFRDTWELELHSYLTYLHDRLLLARALLHESGSCFVQISDDNVHLVRALMEEVFGRDNFVAEIIFRKKTMPLGAKTLECMNDFIVWYARDKEAIKYHQLYKPLDTEGDSHWSWVEEIAGQRRKQTREERSGKNPLPQDARRFQLISLYPPSFSAANVFEVNLNGEKHWPRKGACWLTNPEGMNRLILANRVMREGDQLRYVLYEDDFPWTKLTTTWMDTVGVQRKLYAVQTNEAVVERCLLMTTDVGDLVLDITCGSGTSAIVAEEWGRRWITCDSSRVALVTARYRLATSQFEYYQLAHPDQGVGAGFKHVNAARVSARDIAKNPAFTGSLAPDKIRRLVAASGQLVTLYDHAERDISKARIAGPFTVEAVPAPVVKPIGDEEASPISDASVSRTGVTLRHDEWRQELLRTGIRGKNGQMIRFSRVEPLSGTKWLHADAETRPSNEGADHVKEKAASYGRAERVVISFGPEHAPLEQRQVEWAWQEARALVPRPTMILFASFQFDPEAAKDIDSLTKDRTGMTFLKVQMNADLLTEDLKKKRSSNESFWLIGQPDVSVEEIAEGEHKGKFRVSVHGFDYYNTKSGDIESGDAKKIAMWMLDPDYDERSLFPRQVFFPMAKEGEGWDKLAKSLKAEIDEELIEAYRGTVSLPFERPKGGKVAVKIVDDRGIESLKILEV